jgi:hypothetical protein
MRLFFFHGALLDAVIGRTMPLWQASVLSLSEDNDKKREKEKAVG